MVIIIIIIIIKVEVTTDDVLSNSHSECSMPSSFRNSYRIKLISQCEEILYKHLSRSAF